MVKVTHAMKTNDK